jgi:hypothetical protein
LATIKLLARLGREYRLAPDPQDYWKFCATVLVAGAVLVVLALWLMPILAAARRRFLARPVHSVFFLRISPQLPWRRFEGPPILLACGLTFCLIGALVLWLWPRDPGTMSVWLGPKGEVCSGLLNLGLSLLLLGAVAQALGSQVFARLWHAPRDLPRVRRALAAAALSPVGLIGGGLLIGAALGLAGGGSLRSVFGWLGMLYPTPWVFILPHGFQLPGVAMIPLFLAWWFTLGFLVGAVFRRRWFMLGVWLLLVGCHLGLTLWMLIGALSH